MAIRRGEGHELHARTKRQRSRKRAKAHKRERMDGESLWTWCRHYGLSYSARIRKVGKADPGPLNFKRS